jgi:hypothetical protein
MAYRIPKNGARRVDGGNVGGIAKATRERLENAAMCGT